MGISDRGTKAKTITSCDNAFVTNFVLARDPGASNASEAAHRTPPGKRPAGTEINHLNFIGTVVFRLQKSPLTVASGDFLSCFKRT
ncbi:hypothetical protein CWD94_25905 [Lysinibacillus xylanilyticus]|uniref:Uncharacterized protein n=1 Tax=Lysinibacillus xylanilyticus TaxID=582475 RepID=A0A2M9PYF1_9BACI|nr:hypothetical protein CWD94_25905 [Lysinibacillus xylanilyticus]